MEKMNILLVEDQPTEIESCKSAASLFGMEHGCEIVITSCKSVEEVKAIWKEYAQNSWDETKKDFFDGAIIDLKLGNEQQSVSLGGNEVTSKMEQLVPRMPLIIRTGTPLARDSKLKHVRCLCRDTDEATFANLFDWFLNIRKTGLMKIMSGNGEIERNMNIIFQTVLMPQVSAWIEHTQHDPPQNVERALLRYGMNHLVTLLDQEIECYYPEEFYFLSTAEGKKEAIQSGMILRSTENQLYVVMNPACDLVIRGENGFKATHILLAQIDSFPENIMEMKDKNKKDKFEKLCKNPNNISYCLPATQFFKGGIINFGILTSISKGEFKEKWESLTILCRISTPFLKDMFARFGSCYGRQGQPEISVEAFLRHYKTNSSSKSDSN